MNQVTDQVVYIANYASKTSRDAAEKVLPKTGTMRRQILSLIAEHGGLADFEIEKLLIIHRIISFHLERNRFSLTNFY